MTGLRLLSATMSLGIGGQRKLASLIAGGKGEQALTLQLSKATSAIILIGFIDDLLQLASKAGRFFFRSAGAGGVSLFDGDAVSKPLPQGGGFRPVWRGGIMSDPRKEPDSNDADQKIAPDRAGDE
jgi:hypothetical protein